MSRRATRVVTCVLLGILLLSCGGDDAGDSGSVADQAAAGWWVFDAPDFTLVDGGPTDETVATTTGHDWTLEYNGDGGKTLQLSAWRAGSSGQKVQEASPQIGSAEVDGRDVVLRQGARIPEDEIPPSVFATWVDGDRLLSFGGAGLTEEELRSYLGHVRRVNRASWTKHVQAQPPRPEQPSITQP